MNNEIKEPIRFELKKDKTKRGFDRITFSDYYGDECSIQKSSIMGTDAIWFGINEAKPKLLATSEQGEGVGWVNYPIHPDVFISTRMHLSREQVKEIIPVLQKFVDEGDL